MTYVKLPPPSDDEVIFTDADGNDYTWGQHRQMERWLAEAEEDDPVVKEARVALDAKLEEMGFSVEPPKAIWVCQWCKQTRSQEHLKDCPDWEPPPVREAAGYRYRDASFNVVHTTSVPMTDQEALEYFSVVEVWFHSAKPAYVEVRRFDEGKYEMMPYTYNPETREVTPIE